MYRPRNVEKDRLSELPLEILVTALFYPTEYVKVLMQIGYEPIPPKRSVTVFCQPAMILPNGFSYMAFIKRRDGFIGCYRGLSAMLLGVIVSNQLSPRILKFSQLPRFFPEILSPPDIARPGAPKFKDYLSLMRRNVFVHLGTLVVSYPFQVVSLRMMASFVGREKHYSNIGDAILSVYRDHGFVGFYSGFVPRLIADVMLVSLSSILAFFVNKFVVKNKKQRCYTIPILMLLFSSVTNPYYLVATCMGVAGASMKAGGPPNMPKYRSWQHCLTDLKNNHQDKRGSQFILRYCPGAKVCDATGEILPRDAGCTS